MEAQNGMLFKKMASGLFWGQSSKILETFLSFVFSVLIIRKLKPYDYGMYSYISSIVVFVNLIISLGFTEILSKQIPSLLSQDKWLSARNIIFKLLNIRILLLLLCILLLYSLQIIFPNIYNIRFSNDILLFTALWIFLQGMGDLLIAIFISLFRFRLIFFIRLISQIKAIILTFLLFKWINNSILIPILAMNLLWLVIFLFGIIIIYRQVSEWKHGNINLSGLSNFAIKVWVTNIINFGLTSQLDVIVFGLIMNNSSEIARFNIAVLIVGRIWTFMVAGMSSIILPTFSEGLSTEGDTKVAQLWKIYVKIFIIFLFPVLSFVCIYSKPIIEIIFSDTYLNSVFLMQIYTCIIIISNSLGSLANANIFLVYNRLNIYLITTLLGAINNLLLASLLIPSLKAFGATISLSFAILLTSILQIIFAKKILKILNYPFDVLVKVITATILSLSISLLIIKVSNIIELLGSFLTAGIGFLVISSLLKPISKQEVIWISKINYKLAKIANLFAFNSTSPIS